jgi:hypothetical protein
MSIKPFPHSDKSQIQEDVNKEIERTLKINPLDIESKQFAFLKTTGIVYMRGISPEVKDFDERHQVFTQFDVQKSLRTDTRVYELTTKSKAKDNEKVEATGAELVLTTQMRIDNAKGETVAQGYRNTVQTPTGWTERVLLSTVSDAGVNTVTVTDSTFDREGKKTGTAQMKMEADYKNKTLKTTRTINGREEGTSTIDISNNTIVDPLSTIAQKIAKTMPPLPETGLLATTDIPSQFKATAGGPSKGPSRHGGAGLPA